MQRLVEIRRDITISVEAHPSLFIYTLASWALSIIITALILTVMGLMHTALSDTLFNMLLFAFIIEMLLIVTLLDILRRRLRKDVDDIVDSIKKAVKGADS